MPEKTNLDKLKDEMEINPHEYLFRKVKKTAKTKFNCEYRLNLHTSISYWVINIASLLLIFVGIIEIVRQNNTSAIVVLSLVYSIFILVYSLILKSSNNQNIASEMNARATELLHLADQLQPYCNNNNASIDVYRSFSDEYKNILLLSKEKSKRIDYELMKLDFKDYYELKWRHIAYIKVKYFLGFCHYFIVLLLLIFLIILFLWKGEYL